MRQNLELSAPSGLKLFVGIKAQIQHYCLESKVLVSLKNITFSIVLSKKKRLKNCKNWGVLDHLSFKEKGGM